MQDNASADEYEQIQELIKNLETPDTYKKYIKPYRQACNKGDSQKMKVVTSAIQQVVANKQNCKPMIQLNGVRLIKETLDKNNVEMRQLVEEKVLPQLLVIGVYQKENKSDDRGKTYFSDEPDVDLQVLGNSFFRLVLECLLVWGLWFNNSEYSKGIHHLQGQGVKFPETLNYFKDVDLKALQQQSSFQQDLESQRSQAGNNNATLMSLNQSNIGSQFNPLNGSPDVNNSQNMNNKQQNTPEINSNNKQNYDQNTNGNQQNGNNNQTSQNENININNNNEQQQQQIKPQKVIKSFLDLTQKEDVDLQKVPLKSGTNFRQLSPNGSMYSTITSKKGGLSNNSGVHKIFYASSQQGLGSNRSIMRPGTPQNQSGAFGHSQNNYGFLNPNLSSSKQKQNKYNLGSENNSQIQQQQQQELEDYKAQVKNLHNQVDEVTQDRDYYKAQFEQDSANLKTLQKLYNDLKKEKDELERENLQLQKGSNIL